MPRPKKPPPEPGEEPIRFETRFPASVIDRVEAYARPNRNSRNRELLDLVTEALDARDRAARRKHRAP